MIGKAQQGDGYQPLQEGNAQYIGGGVQRAAAHRADDGAGTDGGVTFLARGKSHVAIPKNHSIERKKSAQIQERKLRRYYLRNVLLLGGSNDCIINTGARQYNASASYLAVSQFLHHISAMSN